MSIESEITRLVEAKQELADWLTDQNVAVPTGALLGDLVALLGQVKTSSSTCATVKQSTASISNGEIIAPGTVIDARDVTDYLCAALAIQVNTPNYMLCMTASKAQYTNSSYTLNTAETSSCIRISDRTLYWCIDPDISAFTDGEQFTVIAVWL